MKYAGISNQGLGIKFAVEDNYGFRTLFLNTNF